MQEHVLAGVNLRGKRIVVTGASAAFGVETALWLPMAHIGSAQRAT